MTEHTQHNKPTRMRGISPPRLNVQMRDREQFDILNSYIPPGMKRRVFLAIVDDLIEKFQLAEENGYTPAEVMADVIAGNLALRYEK